MKELEISITPGDYLRIPLSNIPSGYAAYLQRCDLSKAIIRIIDKEKEDEKETTTRLGSDGL